MAAYNQVIEVRLGAPRWYGPAVWLLFAVIVLGLWATALEWTSAWLVLGLASAVLVSDLRQRSRQRRFRALRIYPNGTAVLIQRDGSPHSVRLRNNFWITRPLIVVRICDKGGLRESILVARDGNQADAYRRFGILCRYAFADSHA